MARRWKKVFFAALGVLLVAAAAFLIPTLWLKPWSINHFYARIFLQFALKRPMTLSSLRILEPWGLDFHSDDLDDASVAFQLEEARWLDRQIEILRSYDREALGEKERISYDVLDWFLANQQEENRFMFHNYPLNQLFGPHTSLPDFMINIHQINRRRDAENYIARVLKFGVYFDQVLEGLKLREQRGILPPRFVVERVLAQMKEFVGKPARESVLYTHFEKKLKELKDLEPAARQELLDRLATVIEKTVYPAYGRLIDYYTDLEPRTTTDDGVWKLPEGEAFYRHRLRSMTTTNLTAEEIHAIGLREVERLQAEMRAILKAEGYPTQDLAATMKRLGEEPRFRYSEGEAGRQEILADYQAIIDDVNRKLDNLFNVRPQVGVKVEPVPEFAQATAPGAYYRPAPFDRSRPASFFVNLRDVNETRKFDMRTLAYHEAIPGHHFQIGIMQELKGVPFFRRVLGLAAYSEGWGLYAERLAAENGFEENPYDRLGYLTAQLFRAVRLVVDTGIHSQRWTREQAIDYMVKNTGMPEGEVVTEIERYIVMPGQACAYMVGMLKILELRQRAQEQLGARFDLKGFHDVVLTNGALPLTLLERLVDTWIASKQVAG